MKYKGIIVVALVMAAVFSVGFWLTQISYKQKAPVPVENLSASFTLSTATETSATIASENWGTPANSENAAVVPDPGAHITAQDDGLSKIYFGVENNKANNLSDNNLGVVFDDLKLKIYLSTTGDNTSVGWYDNKTITLVDNEQSTKNQTSFENTGGVFAPNVSLDIVYEVLENTDNIASGTAPVTEIIPVEVWAKE